MATSFASFRTARKSSICRRVLPICCLWLLLLLLLMILTAGCASSGEAEAAVSSTMSGAGPTTPASTPTEQSDGLETHSTITSTITSGVAGHGSNASTSPRYTSTTLSPESAESGAASSTTIAAARSATTVMAGATTTQPSKPSVSVTQPPATTSTTALAPKDPLPLSCTFLIECSNAVKAGLASNKTILGRQTVKFKDGETVFSVLKRLLGNKGIPMTFEGSSSSAYIVRINGLAEFDGGPDSGWMYNVNGWYPNYSCGAYVLKDGDAVEWRYTCSQGDDL